MSHPVERAEEALLSRAEADARYGTASAEGPISFAREMAELSDKMVAEVMAHFNDHGIDLDYTEESLEDLDRLVSETWPEPIEDKETLEAIVSNWGAYLAQTILENVGGRWAVRSDLEHVSLRFERANLEAFPLHAVRRRFLLGQDAAISTFYEHLIERLTAE